MIMCLNVRSLSSEKSDELLAVVRTNAVGCECVTETGLNRTCRRNLSVWQGSVVREKTALKKEAGEWHVMWPRLFRKNVCTILKKMDAKSYG